MRERKERLAELIQDIISSEFSPVVDESLDPAEVDQEIERWANELLAERAV
jgi:hypothetical protein